MEELLSPSWGGSCEVLGNIQRQGTCQVGAQQRGELRPWLGSHGQEAGMGEGQGARKQGSPGEGSAQPGGCKDEEQRRSCCLWVLDLRLDFL